MVGDNEFLTKCGTLFGYVVYMHDTIVTHYCINISKNVNAHQYKRSKKINISENRKIERFRPNVASFKIPQRPNLITT